MKKIAIILTVTLFLLSCKENTEIHAITVNSPEFRQLKLMDNENELASVSKIWFKAAIVDKSESKVMNNTKLYKIDFDAEPDSKSGRWLYSASGYYRRLSKAPQPTYKIRDVAKLNELFGIN